ncbi:MnhB domain-containing protein [Streptacidiphilus neutrinimicus]|uniref:MnhB domain-containing protein n=1 Tax=Streptacidiphilus neutrinimicus TaxID=105420 RepID=UPI0005A73C5D|nr:MnhB domain-containing protein [Streptacidiphilus neutrinimicus]
MTRRARTRLFLAAAAVIAAVFALACLRLPPFGTQTHPYADRAVEATMRQRTANTVSSVNFDQRAFDTLGEETILFAAVLGAVGLLRRTADERRTRPRPVAVLPSTRLFGAVMLPITLLTGVYIVGHGQLSPGGGFQGGVILATGVHLSYLAADYRVLDRLRHREALDRADALAAGTFAALGLIGLGAGAAYLQNVLHLGTFNQLVSGGLVPYINAAVGVEVATGVIVILAHFLDQTEEFAGGGKGGSR